MGGTKDKKNAASMKFGLLGAAGRDAGLGAAALQVLMLLVVEYDRGCGAWPSLATLQSETGRDRRTITRALDGLVKRGYLRRERGGGRGQTTRYAPTYENRGTDAPLYEKNRGADAQKQGHGRPETGALTPPNTFKDSFEDSFRSRACAREAAGKQEYPEIDDEAGQLSAETEERISNLVGRLARQGAYGEVFGWWATPETEVRAAIEHLGEARALVRLEGMAGKMFGEVLRNAVAALAAGRDPDTTRRPRDRGHTIASGAIEELGGELSDDGSIDPFGDEADDRRLAERMKRHFERHGDPITPRHPTEARRLFRLGLLPPEVAEANGVKIQEAAR